MSRETANHFSAAGTAFSILRRTRHAPWSALREMPQTPARWRYPMPLRQQVRLRLTSSRRLAGLVARHEHGSHCEARRTRQRDSGRAPAVSSWFRVFRFVLCPSNLRQANRLVTGVTSLPVQTASEQPAWQPPSTERETTTTTSASRSPRHLRLLPDRPAELRVPTWLDGLLADAARGQVQLFVESAAGCFALSPLHGYRGSISASSSASQSDATARNQPFS
jgi:hypothetical protein